MFVTLRRLGITYLWCFVYMTRRVNRMDRAILLIISVILIGMNRVLQLKVAVKL